MTTKFFWGSTRELTRKKQQQQQKLNRLNNHSKTGVETGKEKQQQQKNRGIVKTLRIANIYVRCI